MTIAMTATRDLPYKPAREAATERHNIELRQHTGRPRSYGSGLVVICDCGQASFNLTAWRDHLVSVCIATPVRSS